MEYLKKNIFSFMLQMEWVEKNVDLTRFQLFKPE